MTSSSPMVSSPETRIIVVGDGDFMKDDFSRNPGNLTFFVNMVDYLADDAGLITIRSKNVAMPPLEQISDGTKKLLKYGDLLLPPYCCYRLWPDSMANAACTEKSNGSFTITFLNIGMKKNIYVLLGIFAVLIVVALCVDEPAGGAGHFGRQRPASCGLSTRPLSTKSKSNRR